MPGRRVRAAPAARIPTPRAASTSPSSPTASTCRSRTTRRTGCGRSDRGRAIAGCSTARACPSSSSPILTAIRSTSRACVGARWCSSRGRRGEDAASTCPGGRSLHEEVTPAGVDIVTVALDTDVEAARPFHDAAPATHPSLVDPAHELVAHFGMTNAPFAIWIDEDGTIVRPAEVAFAPRPPNDERRDQSSFVSQLPERQRTIIEGMTANIGDTERYAAAVRDWAERGADSPYVLSEAEVIERSRPRPVEFGLAAAHFELAPAPAPVRVRARRRRRTSRRPTASTRRTGAITARRSASSTPSGARSTNATCSARSKPSASTPFYPAARHVSRGA